MRHAGTSTFSLSDGALDTTANQKKPQLAVSYPDIISRHQFGGGCQVMMAEGGERSHEDVVDEDLVVKTNSTSATWTYFGFRRDDVLQTQVRCKTGRARPTSITSCITTIKTYTNTSKLTLAIINCVVNNMQTSIFVYLSQVISSSQYWTVLTHIADFKLSEVKAN